ncbi:MAG: hypothetical protein RBT20_12300 [Syntrophales bacterium]|jgi:hypothetical protein|nr:hypothetical protein [Syntrophales bacterium]
MGILPMALSERIGMITTCNPVEGGLLTGKYAESDRQKASRLDTLPSYQRRCGEAWMQKSAGFVAVLLLSSVMTVRMKHPHHPAVPA